MKKENIEKLIKIIEEKREDIIEMSKKCYKKSLDGSCFQGWNVGVIVYTNGDIDTFYRSQNTTTQAEIEGDAVTVINYTVTNDLGEITYNAEDLTDLEQKKFKKFLIENGYIENSAEWETELNYDNLNEFDLDILNRINDENLEFEVDDNYASIADEKIDDTIEFLKIELQNALQYEN